MNTVIDILQWTENELSISVMAIRKSIEGMERGKYLLDPKKQANGFIDVCCRHIYIGKHNKLSQMEVL